MLRRIFTFAGLVLAVLLLDAALLSMQALAQTDAGGAGGLPPEVQVFLALVNAGGFVTGVFAFIKGWIIPGFIHDQSLARESTTKAELNALREKVDDKILPEMTRSRETQDQSRKLMERFLPIVERFIISAERAERREER